ncbi:tRNA pseudouridine(13) synthase TruD [Motiliproteus sp. MSK22-1]|uniref:tRNA pseudouridine(13) synthase TruD n=1 Tax=Motiliproteus sp. MSK22-1 TaxID=1897630 RepID=UPI000976C7CE|nr:tRNA pseudouridine(13) synthase TruD [Motiliproteus sp. MSK22-1]OMH39178.1 tRNA pseudouridine(13) synthase TruD [Motiliproteus sp. MSK22-1]
MNQSVDHSLDFPRYHGEPPCSGVIRQQPEDFQVDELLGFEPSGNGEHVYLKIRKKGENTLWLTKQLACLAGVNVSDVGYAGLKDRNAVTTQWFSVWLPGNTEPDWNQLQSPSVNILVTTRHSRKLKRGIHKANRFLLKIRELEVSGELESRLQKLRSKGVPNYYGEQRFGHDGGNLQQADALLSGKVRIKDRQRRGIYLSAARSFLFNEVVAERVRRSILGRYLKGDRLMIEGTSNLSREEELSIVTEQLDSLQLHPTAPLYGQGRALVEADSLDLEAGILTTNSAWCKGLERAGLRRERRAVRLALPSLQWEMLDDRCLQLSFELPSGCFATSVLRECCRYRVAESMPV